LKLMLPDSLSPAAKVFAGMVVDVAVTGKVLFKQ
jgi:hypothetical protein